MKIKKIKIFSSKPKRIKVEVDKKEGLEYEWY